MFNIYLYFSICDIVTLSFDKLRKGERKTELENLNNGDSFRFDERWLAERVGDFGLDEKFD